MKKYLSLPHIAFSAYLIKILVLPATINDAIIFLCSTALLGLYMHKHHVENSVKDNFTKHLLSIDQEISKIKGAIDSIKMSRTIKMNPDEKQSTKRLF